MRLQAEPDRVAIVAGLARAVGLSPHDEVTRRIVLDGVAELVHAATAALTRAGCPVLS